jgi:hypothetical protein
MSTTERANDSRDDQVVSGGYEQWSQHGKRVRNGEESLASTSETYNLTLPCIIRTTEYMSWRAAARAEKPPTSMQMPIITETMNARLPPRHA